MAILSVWEASYKGSDYDKWLTTTTQDMGHDSLCHCSSCHSYHRQEKEFGEDCLRCEAERCVVCKGTGWIDFDNDVECINCEATGWRVSIIIH